MCPTSSLYYSVISPLAVGWRIAQPSPPPPTHPPTNPPPPPPPPDPSRTVCVDRHMQTQQNKQIQNHTTFQTSDRISLHLITNTSSSRCCTHLLITPKQQIQDSHSRRANTILPCGDSATSERDAFMHGMSAGRAHRLKVSPACRQTECCLTSWCSISTSL